MSLYYNLHFQLSQTVEQLTEEMDPQILVPVISKSSKRVKRKFRGLDGKFAASKSGESKMSPSQCKPSKPSSDFKPQVEERAKRKCLLEALNRVKLWTNEKSENVLNLNRNQRRESAEAKMKTGRKNRGTVGNTNTLIQWDLNNVVQVDCCNSE